MFWVGLLIVGGAILLTQILPPLLQELEELVDVPCPPVREPLREVAEDDAVAQAERVVEDYIRRTSVTLVPLPRITPQPGPTSQPATPTLAPSPTPTSTPTPQTIVELGAGDYRNAIAMQEANPGATVIATNLRSDWEEGRVASQYGVSAADNVFVAFYQGWLEAQEIPGMQVVGVSGGPIQNQEVSDHIGDLVYTILPYPSTGYAFGRDAARIASYDSGTVVAVTTGLVGVANSFVDGFQTVRPNSLFIEVQGSPFGVPGNWHEANFITRFYVVP